jgi:hypothetical protein
MINTCPRARNGMRIGEETKARVGKNSKPQAISQPLLSHPYPHAAGCYKKRPLIIL